MKNKRKVIIIMIVVLVLIIMFKFLISYLNRPSEGSINIVRVIPTTAPSINMQPTLINGEYVSFDYPKGMRVVPKNSIGSPVVSVYDFSYNDIESWDLAISIFLVPSGKLSDNNAYQLREMNSAEYTQSTQVINGQSIIIMTDNTIGYYNKVAFLVHGQYQATISLSGDDQDGNTNLIKTLNMILNSWTWKP